MNYKYIYVNNDKRLHLPGIQIEMLNVQVELQVRIIARNNIEKICAKKQNVQRKLGIRQFISSFTIATSLLEIVTHVWLWILV